MKKHYLGAISALSLVLVNTVCAEATKYEAESQPGVEASAIVEGTDFSGGKYVTPGSDAMTFTITVDETAVYDITTSVLIKQYDWTTSKILVNGVEVGSALTTPRNCDSSYVVSASAKMKVGENTITVGNEAIGVDYITVERHPDATFNISSTPVTPGATESAKKILAFLKQNFQKKVVTGMMISDQKFNYDYDAGKLVINEDCATKPDSSCWKEQEDIKGFYKKAGHYPALGGFDMLFAVGGNSDNGWFKGYTENHVAMAKELWDLGGIPTFTWHWKVGKDTVFYTQESGFKNPGCTEGIEGTAKNNTCFNYTKAFKDEQCKEIDETSEEYKEIIADIDVVSGYMKQLEEQGVGIVWRPLHEASGGWFWWGVASAECYIQLYRLVFDRMVNTNKNKNLLWVWNINNDPAFGYDYSGLNAAWYPGDEYVDIVGVDVYGTAYPPILQNNSAANYYNKIVSDVGTNKMIALTENGAFPDIDSIAEDKSYWSYWMSWSQTWEGNFLNQTTDDVWKKNFADERIISLDNMPGWANVSVEPEPTIDPPIDPESIVRSDIFAFGASVLMQGKTLHIYLNNAKNATIGIFDSKGKLVKKLKNKGVSNGQLNYSLAEFSQGTYYVRIIAKGVSATQKIVIK